MDPIIPIVRKEPFDDPAWLFELKYDGFRGIADTIRGRMLSKNKNRLKSFERLLCRLPEGCNEQVPHNGIADLLRSARSRS
jgi:hypothetical protein